MMERRALESATELIQSSTTSCDAVRVLLVDDNDAVLTRAADALVPACLIVGVARDGESALRSVRSLHPDVVVLDISMPGLTGLEVASCLRKTGSGPAIVFLTIHDEDEVIDAAQGAGGLGYVTKPRLASDLMPAVLAAQAGRSFVSPRS
jgi:DNA-binding NarL/FixJ family response regulator